ncbi:MAG: hypothetical protein AAF171_13755 [Cyanobacteria bacterium P01_A01_bin.116]
MLLSPMLLLKKSIHAQLTHVQPRKTLARLILVPLIHAQLTLARLTHAQLILVQAVNH